jgi:hypothetical protein
MAFATMTFRSELEMERWIVARSCKVCGEHFADLPEPLPRGADGRRICSRCVARAEEVSRA